ncbi:hypothetical protein [Sinorhizobium meliloti]|uniref:hypothetical protein n=1 Tax=Rhizobium meliloti TaxID=382 RepID=UPI0013E39B9C|nr:hypothetical protein [Sinorhizobium meliloti]
MPRTGGVYSPPAGTKGVSNTTIQSVPYNALVDDLTADANAARPVTAGGTGATTASGARTALGLAIGTNVQAYDALLQSIADLTTSANQMIYLTATDTAAVATITAYGRSLIDDADATTARGTLGLGTAATQNTGTSGATLPFLNGANTWSGQQTFTGGIKYTGSTGITNTVSGATTDVLSLSSSNSNVSTSGAWAQFYGSAHATTPGAMVITSGTGGNIDLRNAGSNKAHITATGLDIPSGSQITFGNSTVIGNVLTNLGVSAYVQTLLNDADAGTARGTLGLGTAATQNTSTSGANVPLLNGTNTWSAMQTLPEITVDPTAGASGIRLRPSDTSSGRMFWESDSHTWSSYVQESTGDLLFSNGGTYGSASGTLQARITSSGGITINGDFLAGGSLTVGSGAVAGSATSPTINFGASVGIYRVSDAIRFTYAGSGVVDITATGIRLPTNMAISFAGTGAATTRTNLGLGGLAVMDVTALLYTGSSVSNTVFPVGSIVFASLGGTRPDLNSTTTVRLSGTTGYSIEGAEAALSGTWRHRGGYTVSGDRFGIYQRVA